MFIDYLGRLLVGTMPLAFLVKTITFIGLWTIMQFQRSGTRLGIWLSRFFIVLFLVSGLVTLFVNYVVQHSSTRDPHGPYEWALVGAMNALPVTLAFCGIMVVYCIRVIEATEPTPCEEEEDNDDDATRQEDDAAVGES